MNLEYLKRKAAFLLALAIPFNLAGCGNQERLEEESNSSSVVDSKIPFSNAEFTEFLKRMSEIIPLYNLEEIYFTDEEIAAIMKEAETNKECTSNTLVDVDEITKQIIQNSNDSNGMLSISYDLSFDEKKEMDKKIRGALEVAIANLVHSRSITKEDACTLKSLKIVIAPINHGSNIIFYNIPENILTIDYIAFRKCYSGIELEALRENVINEGLMRYLEYGINCARERACDCRIKQGQTNYYPLGINNPSVLDQMIKVNGYNGHLGETNKRIFDGIQSKTNYDISLLLLLAVFKDNRNIEDLKQFMVDCNLPGIFEYFGLTSEEEIAEFYRILGTIDILTSNSDYENNFYEETGSTSILDYRNHVGYAYKASLFKSSVTDLMKYIASKQDLTKNEAMFLYKYVKSIAVNQTFTSQGPVYSYEESYAKNILDIENIYFEFLSKFYGISLDEVDSLYENYYSFDYLESGREDLDIDYSRLIGKFPLLQSIQTYYSPYDFFVDDFDLSTGRK